MAEAIQDKPGAFKRELVKAAIVLLIAFSGWIIPAPAPITDVGMRVITVFLSMVVGWTMTGNVWVSLAGLVLFPLTGVMTFNQYLAAGWGSNALFFMIFAFVLVGF